MNGFFKFVVRGNVVGLAVGVVIGAAFSAMVSAFVDAFLTPLVGIATSTVGNEDNKSFFVGKTEFKYGHFINTGITFLLTAAVIYFLVVLPINKLVEELNPHHDLTKAKRSCPDCLQQIPAEAKRCSYCTAHVTPITDEDSDKLIEEREGEISISAPIAFKMPAGEKAAAEGAAKAE
jgi:large conductance mechanosensitive channel